LRRLTGARRRWGEQTRNLTTTGFFLRRMKIKKKKICQFVIPELNYFNEVVSFYPEYEG
jgi:hypothetical protein